MCPDVFWRAISCPFVYLQGCCCSCCLRSGLWMLRWHEQRQHSLRPQTGLTRFSADCLVFAYAVLGCCTLLSLEHATPAAHTCFGSAACGAELECFNLVSVRSHCLRFSCPPFYDCGTRMLLRAGWCLAECRGTHMDGHRVVALGVIRGGMWAAVLGSSVINVLLVPVLPWLPIAITNVY